MSDIEWDPEATDRINKAPFFIRKMAKKKVENAARELGEDRVTLELMEKIKKQTMG